MSIEKPQSQGVVSASSRGLKPHCLGAAEGTKAQQHLLFQIGVAV